MSKNKKENMSPYAVVRLRKEHARAGLAELDLAKKKGELVEMAWVKKTIIEKELIVKRVFLYLPRKMAPQLVNKGPIEIEAALTGEIFQIMRTLARTGQDENEAPN